MSRRLLSACLGAAVLVGVGNGSVGAGEPGENPPLSAGAIMQPAAPEGFVPVEPKMIPGTLANDEGLWAHPLLTMSRQDIEIPQVAHSGSDMEWQESTLCRKWKILRSVAKEELPAIPSMYDSLPAVLPTPALYQLPPTTRRKMTSWVLFGVNPALALLSTEKALDAPGDHPQQVAGEDVINGMPQWEYGTGGSFRETKEMAKERNRRSGDWFKWLLSHWPIQRNVPGPEQNEGYVYPNLRSTFIASLTPVDTPAEEIDAPLVPTIEILPMPQEDTPARKKHKKKTEVLPMPQEDAASTCPWMRQQATDRHACQFADPAIGRSVLENFERLEEADHLLDLAKKFAGEGCIGEALECCAVAENLCPGSPCAARAADVMCEMYVRLCEPATSTDEDTVSADQMEEEWKRIWFDSTIRKEPGIEQQVKGLMKACRLLMNEGLHEQAAELARQAFLLDPARVAADPLVYKMHLLATTPDKHSAGSEEASEPPSCPYCPSNGKPIPGIVPAKKKVKSGPTTLLVPPVPPVDYEVVSGEEEASEETGPSSLGELAEAMMGGPGRAQFGFGVNGDGSLRLCGECTCFGTIYHVLFSRGALAIWKTPDAAAVQP